MTSTPLYDTMAPMGISRVCWCCWTCDGVRLAETTRFREGEDGEVPVIALWGLYHDGRALKFLGDMLGEPERRGVTVCDASLLPRPYGRVKKTEREKSVIVDGYFNVRNLKSFYSPIGPGIKHLSTKGCHWWQTYTYKKGYIYKMIYGTTEPSMREKGL